MSKVFECHVFEHKGYTFRADFEPDYCNEYPWENDDGHGPVRKSFNPHRDWRSDKRPGERPLNSPDRNEYQFYYDWQAAIKIAELDGWNAAPYDAPNRALRAVQADFDYLRAFLANEWEYVTVRLVQIDEDGNELNESDMVSMVETYNDGHMLAAVEMADYTASTIQQSEKREKINARFSDAMLCGV